MNDDRSAPRRHDRSNPAWKKARINPFHELSEKYEAEHSAEDGAVVCVCLYFFLAAVPASVLGF